MTAAKDILEQWPRPRVGQHIKLRDGHEAEVLIVRSCNQVLKLMPEAQAMLFGPRIRATYGKHWQEIYFECDVLVRLQRRRVMRTVTPNDIADILDKWL